MTSVTAVRHRLASLPRSGRLAFALIAATATVSQGTALLTRASTARVALVASKTQLLTAKDSLEGLSAIRKEYRADSTHLEIALRQSFIGRTAAAEGAELAAYVSDAARRSGYEITSMDVHAAADSHIVLARPRVVVQGTADLSAFVQFLLLLELRERTVRTIEVRAEATSIFAEPEQPDVLRASVTIEGAAFRQSHLSDSAIGFLRSRRGDVP